MRELKILFTDAEYAHWERLPDAAKTALVTGLKEMAESFFDNPTSEELDSASWDSTTPTKNSSSTGSTKTLSSNSVPSVNPPTSNQQPSAKDSLPSGLDSDFMSVYSELKDSPEILPDDNAHHEASDFKEGAD